MTALDQASAAVNVMQEWLGEGGVPVPQGIAEHRSVICASCPENQHGKWWEQAKYPIAKIMLRHLEAKNSMAIWVPNEELLNMCHVCGCCLPLKVHVPLKHILANTDAETLAKFPKHCWIANEKQESP